MITIKVGDVFLDSQGHTLKIDKITEDKVSYSENGGTTGGNSTKYNVVKLLEQGRYQNISDAVSSFFMPKITPEYNGVTVGEKIVSGGPEGYTAEVIRKESDSVYVRFSTSDKQNNTIYMYAEEGFELKNVFTAEVCAELSNKFNVNVFEVIGVTKDGQDVKFTVVGKSVNKELLDKIERAYSGAKIYQVKRLTNINIQ
jgi:hypothetical protein